MKRRVGKVARTSPRAVGRVTDILELLARRRMGVSFSDIARQVGVPKASLSDLLAGLSSGNFLYRDGDGHYFLGPKAVALARLMISSGGFVELAHPLVEELSRRSGETALIGCLDDESMKTVYIDKAECGNPIRYTGTLGLKRELYATAVGKVLLADFSRERLEAYLRTVVLERFTPCTLVDVPALLANLNKVRVTGAGVTEDERIMGASGVAAPITDHRGHVVAAIAVAGPTVRVRRVRARLVTLVIDTAKELSRLLSRQAAGIVWIDKPTEVRREM